MSIHDPGDLSADLCAGRPCMIGKTDQHTDRLCRTLVINQGPSQRPARGDHPGHRDHDRTLSAALCGARALLLVSDRSQAGVLAEGVEFTAKTSSTNPELLSRRNDPMLGPLSRLLIG